MDRVELRSQGFIPEIKKAISAVKNGNESAASEAKMALHIWRESGRILDTYGHQRNLRVARRPDGGPILSVAQTLERRETNWVGVDQKSNLRLMLVGTKEYGDAWEYELMGKLDRDIYETRVAFIKPFVILDGNRRDIENPDFISLAVQTIGDRLSSKPQA